MDNKNEIRINQNASRGLTFLFSLLPGGGHLYLGLMRRGVQLMTLFFACIFLVADILGLPEIGVPLCIITFFYSLFDAQHANKAIRRGEGVRDADIVSMKGDSLNGYHYGIIAILLGFFFLFDRLETVISKLMPFGLYHTIQRSFTPLIIIGVGIYLLWKSKKTPDNEGSAQGPLEDTSTDT
ncbi:MAG TPA: hypothetical protein VFD33_06865 [Bacillota bacterium]|nr:hypothetical protein [Bacillota bacterium]